MTDPFADVECPLELPDNFEIESNFDFDLAFGEFTSDSESGSEEEPKDLPQPQEAEFSEVLDKIEELNDGLRRSQRPRKKKIFTDVVSSFSEDSSDVEVESIDERLKRVNCRYFNRSNLTLKKKKVKDKVPSSGLGDGPQNVEDPELTHFLRSGTFRRASDPTFREQFDVKKICEKKFDKVVNDVIKNSWFDAEVKEGVKSAIISVLCNSMNVKRALRQYKLEWMDFDVILTRIYQKLGFDEYGFKEKKISFPSINTDDLTTLDDVESVGSKSPEPFGDAEQFSELDGVEILSKSAERRIFGKENNVADKRKTINNFAILGKHANGRKYARYGIYIPSHWKKHKEAMKAGICRSLEFHNYRSHSMLVKRVGVADKYLAIEDILINGGSVKHNAVRYHINYSTLQNFSHRAIYVISRVLGEAKLSPEANAKRREGLSWEQIFCDMVAEAPTCTVRVLFNRRK